MGNWPVWTIAAGIGIYACWAILYAEVTVQRTRRRAMWQRWRWDGARRLRGRPAVELASASVPQPVQEHPAS
jgi:hypothetical protein